MRQELDDKLVNECPNLYRDRHADKSVTCMCWGFTCGDGWFDLIYEASKKIEAILVAMPEEERKNFKASQVKEKFGTLRFYMTGHNDSIEEIIDQAHERSTVTCEDCGKEGKLRGNRRWIVTLCDECDAKPHP